MMLLLLACAAPEGAPEAPLVPTPYTPDQEAVTAPPPLSTAELAEALQIVVDVLPTIKPRQLHDTWQRLMLYHADADCPAVIDHNGQDHWREDLCVSDSGAEFRGWSLYYRSLPQAPSSEFLRETGWLSGQARIVTPDGHRLDSFGDALHEYFVRSSGGSGNRGFVFGDFLYTGPEGEGTWLQSGVTVESYFNYEDKGGWFQTNLDTWIAGLPGPAPAVIFESFLLKNEPDHCGMEPIGSVRVRDAAGQWVELDFDGPDAHPLDCDGCGEAWLGSELLGEVCVDWSPLLFIWGADP